MDTYKLYLDKSNNFQCKLQLEGASLDNSQARLILEGRTKKFLFDGTISQSGECEIALEKLSEIFKEGEEGKMTLEIIADDVYFRPWESEFNVDVSKKLRVEVASTTKAPPKPTISVVVTSPAEKEFATLVESVSKKLKQNGITLTNASKKQKEIVKIVVESRHECKYDHDVGTVVSHIVKNLT